MFEIYLKILDICTRKCGKIFNKKLIYIHVYQNYPFETFYWTFHHVTVYFIVQVSHALEKLNGNVQRMDTLKCVMRDF